MTADSVKGVKHLFLGVAAALLLTSITFETPHMQNSRKVASVRAPDPLFRLQPGIFHPLTEEYVRRQTKQLPYDFRDSDIFAAPETREVFASHSPLELALLTPEEGGLRKKTIRKLPMGEYDREWRPLESDEYEAREQKLAEKAVEMGAEIVDSLSMPTVADSILWTTKRFNAYHDYLLEQYRLHFNVSGDDARVTYKVKY